MPGTRKLGKPTDQRMSMLRGQVTYLLENGTLRTTVTRAKELRCLADRMITLGKKNTLAARRRAMSFITKEDVVKKLFDVIAPSFEERAGGYTRVLKLGPRRGDGAEMAIIELVKEEKKEKEKKSTSKKSASSAVKKPAAKKPASKAKAKSAEAKEEEAEEQKVEEAEVKAEKVQEETPAEAETVQAEASEEQPTEASETAES